MLINNRVIFSNNGVLSDLSLKIGSYSSGSEVIDIVAAQDYIYVGSDLPFNHRYFEIGVAQSNTAAIADIEYRFANGWESVVNIQDETTVSGKVLAQSGIISFTTKKGNVWEQEDTNDGGSVITELSSVVIYDLYWMRLSFTANFNGTFALKYIGHKFADDNDLRVKYPDLIRSDVLDHFETGKTNWNEQMISASEYIIRDLKRKGLIVSGNQLLDSNTFMDACVHKCAEMIYIGFGKDFTENRKDAANEYSKAINVSIANIDANGDALLNPSEKKIRTGLLIR